MMVFKRITTKKTNTGYSILVFVHEGEIAQALRTGIERFFVKVDEDQNSQRRLQIEQEADKEMEALKHATQA